MHWLGIMQSDASAEASCLVSPGAQVTNTMKNSFQQPEEKECPCRSLDGL